MGGAESVVGGLVAEAGLRRGVFLATKLEDYDHRTGPTQLQASLRRLRTDEVDLMQLHNISDPRQLRVRELFYLAAAFSHRPKVGGKAFEGHRPRLSEKICADDGAIST
jgi:diketogulonate reductase-like aldo/keto reductase